MKRFYGWTCLIVVVAAIMVFSAGCSLISTPSPTPTMTLTSSNTPSPTLTSTNTPTMTLTNTPTPTRTPTNTFTPTPVYNSPGDYLVGRCFIYPGIGPVRFYQYHYVENAIVGIIYECISDVRIQEDRTMIFNMYWLASRTLYPPDRGPKMHKSGETRQNYYLTDDLGNRYDTVSAGGSIGKGISLFDNTSCTGWLSFPAAKEGARVFTFHDILYKKTIDGIILLTKGKNFSH
jgi:hypothetical protein